MKQLAIIGLAAALACANGDADPRFPHLRQDAEPLRSSFNRAAGKVRAVFLASPT